ncbi:MAG: hypothetical protein QM302_03460 [Acidobacteriota bacterium]|nr:hypothetical protein [Acidobacteriota bacterium]
MDTAGESESSEEMATAVAVRVRAGLQEYSSISVTFDLDAQDAAAYDCFCESGALIADMDGGNVQVVAPGFEGVREGIRRGCPDGEVVMVACVVAAIGFSLDGCDQDGRDSSMKTQGGT